MQDAQYMYNACPIKDFEHWLINNAHAVYR